MKTLFLVKTKLSIYILTSKKQIDFGIDTTTCFVLGKKNGKYLSIINEKEKLFDSIVAFDYPRYIIQYKSKRKEIYIDEYIDTLITR